MLDFVSRKCGRQYALNGLRGLISLIVILRHFPLTHSNGREMYVSRNNRASVVYFFMIGGFMTQYTTRCAMETWRCSMLSIFKRFLRLAPVYYLGVQGDILRFFWYLSEYDFTAEIVLKSLYQFTWYGKTDYAALSFYHWYPVVAFWAHVVFTIFLHNYIFKSLIEVLKWRENNNDRDIVDATTAITAKSTKAQTPSIRAHLLRFWPFLVATPVLLSFIPSLSLILNITYFSEPGVIASFYFFAPQRMFEVFLGSMCYVFYFLFLQPWFKSKSDEYKRLFGYIIDAVIILMCTFQYQVIPGIEEDLHILELNYQKDLSGVFWSCGGVAPFIGLKVLLLTLDEGLIAQFLSTKPLQMLGDCSYETFFLHLMIDGLYCVPYGIPIQDRLYYLLPLSVIFGYIINKFITGPLSERLARIPPQCPCEEDRKNKLKNASLNLV